MADWSTYEVIHRDSDGKLTDQGERVVSTTMRNGGDVSTAALTKMRMLQHHGWPAARAYLKIDKVDERGSAIYVLKCKPSCWRLYFNVRQEKRQFIYVHACCKKKQKRDSEDSQRARNVLDGLGAGRSGIIRFEFPSD